MQNVSPLLSPPASSDGTLAALESTRAALTHDFDALEEKIVAQEARDQNLLSELEQARAHIAGLEERCEQLQGERAHLQGELGERNLHLQQQNARVLEVEGEREQVRAENAGLHERLTDSVHQLAYSQAQVGDLHAHVEELSAHQTHLEGHRAQLQGEVEQLHGHKSSLEETIARLHERNAGMHRELVALYTDLRTEGLPELVLKLAAGLTGAESGLFTEADGDGTLAQLHLSDMEEMLVGALYDYSRRAAHSDEPLVENDAKKLPDGAGLVNLAALPVAAKGKKRGVLLLCNKRSGPFTDEDTQILLAIGQHAGLAMENSRLHDELNEAYAATIAVLADAIQAKDAYTRGHCEGVSKLAVEVGRRLELGEEQLQQVRYAALLHDVGKIGIPDGILLKPSKLMAEEFMIIQKHPQIGRDIVARVAALSGLGDVILHHHEKWDGSGYPEGLAGEGIPLISRIVGAVDAFDAMTSPRPYRSPVESAIAVEELRRCAGSQFDPHIVELVADIVCAL